jgi:hypothetical protein
MTHHSRCRTLICLIGNFHQFLYFNMMIVPIVSSLPCWLIRDIYIYTHTWGSCLIEAQKLFSFVYMHIVMAYMMKMVQKVQGRLVSQEAGSALGDLHSSKGMDILEYRTPSMHAGLQFIHYITY